MLKCNFPEYETIIANAIENIRCTAQRWRSFMADHNICSSDCVILLSSEDAEVNYYTLHYLPAYRSKNKLNHFLILSYHPQTEDFVRQHTTVPYTFAWIEREQADAFSRLYGIYPYTTQLVINSFRLSTDADAFRLVDGKDIMKKDVVARVILQLDDTPDETELSDVSNQPSVKMKSIDWSEPSTIPPIHPMGETDLKRITWHAIHPLLDSQQITNRHSIALFGVTQTAQAIADHLKDYSIVAYLDNNKEKSGEKVGDISVFLPDDRLKPYDENLRILVCSRRYKAICEQLYALGYELNKQVFITFSISKPSDAPNASETYVEDIIKNKIYAGKKIYESLRERYPNETLIVRPYQGTGDIYLLGGYMDQVLRNHHIDKYVLTVISTSIKKTAELFGINATICEQTDAFMLLQFGRTVGFDKLGILPLNDNLDQTDLVRIRGYKNLDSHTFFQKVVFECEERAHSFPFEQENSDPLFEQYNLKKGKTVLLSPYAITIPCLPMENWERIADFLIQRGCCVCTNVSSDKEKTIPGTTGIFIPYRQVVDFINKAGGFIGLRNGLCDIISSSPVPMALFYPQNQIRPGDFYFRCYSLIRMDLKYDNLLELKYEDSLDDAQIREVINFITEGQDHE